MIRTIFVVALVLLEFISCRDLGVEMDKPAVPELQWIQVRAFHYARSGWLDFISIEALVGAFPDSLRARVPDSIKVVNHSDRDTVYVGSGITGGWEPGTTLYANYYKKFQFPDGYIDQLQRVLSLSVFIKYNN